MKKLVGLLALIILTLPAFAGAQDVAFDPTSGEGFVGRSTLQTGFGLNQGQLKKEADRIHFLYTLEAIYPVRCWDGTQKSVAQAYYYELSSGVVNPKGKFIGVALLGFTSEPSITPAPAASAVCEKDGIIGDLSYIRHTLSADLLGKVIVLSSGASAP